jgi:hypothetical protein
MFGPPLNKPLFSLRYHLYNFILGYGLHKLLKFNENHESCFGACLKGPQFLELECPDILGTNVGFINFCTRNTNKIRPTILVLAENARIYTCMRVHTHARGQTDGIAKTTFS